MPSNKESVETKLQRIALKASKDKDCQFTSLFHLMNEELLLKCFAKLKGKAASDIDKITKQAYAENLTSNLQNLLKRVQAGLAKILQTIYEQDFINDSYGFRPKRSCHDALRALSESVET